MVTLHDTKSTVHMKTYAHTHTHTTHIYNTCKLFLIAKILSIPETMHSFTHGLLNEDIREEWTLEEQRNTTCTQDVRGNKTKRRNKN